MKAVRVKIKPESPFGTFPRGDVLFGHFLYWGTLLERNGLLAELKPSDLLEAKMGVSKPFAPWYEKGKEKCPHFLRLFKDYTNCEGNIGTAKPPVIFSDLFPHGYLPFPQLPLQLIGVKEDEKKEFRKIRYISIEDLMRLGDIIKNGEPIPNPEKGNNKLHDWQLRIRNSINRVTFTTGEAPFTPYPTGQHTFYTYLDLYLLYDPDRLTLPQILTLLELIGRSGFGKKATIGLGHFQICDFEEEESLQNFFQKERKNAEEWRQRAKVEITGNSKKELEESIKKVLTPHLNDKETFSHYISLIKKGVEEQLEKIIEERLDETDLKVYKASKREESEKVETEEVTFHLALASVTFGKIEPERGVSLPIPTTASQMLGLLETEEIDGEEVKRAYYSPVVKFGRFYTTREPFKSPAIIAQTGAVFKLEKPMDYFGSGVCNSISEEKCCEEIENYLTDGWALNSHQRSLLQGFAPVVQFKIEVKSRSKVAPEGGKNG
jgi:hypothetical protein